MICGLQQDGTSELEKITINLGLVDLGQIGLLVREGFYANRTDFIRTAIRNQLAAHAEALRRTVVRKELVFGLQHYTREDLEAVRAAGETLDGRPFQGLRHALYTAPYFPAEGRVEYRWPGFVCEQSFDDFEEGTHTVTIGATPSGDERDRWVRQPGRSAVAAGNWP